MKEKIAVVGMEALWKSAEGLDAFEHHIYDANLWQTGNSKEPVTNGCNPSEFQNASELLNRVISGVLQDTRSISTEDNLDDVAILAISDSDLLNHQGSSKEIIEEDSVFNALKTARDLLCDQKAKTVTIGGISRSLIAAAVVLKMMDQAEEDRDRIYAVIDAMELDLLLLPESTVTPQHVADICREAFASAVIKPDDIAYLEISANASAEENQSGVDGILQAYQADKEGLNCALGSLHNSYGNSSPAIEIAGLIKIALCLYHRFIPATPRGGVAGQISLNDNSPFYIPAESRTWFMPRGISRRIAALNSISKKGIAHLILSEYKSAQPDHGSYLSNVPPYYLPVAGDSKSDLIDQLGRLLQFIESALCLTEAVGKSYSSFQDKTEAGFAFVVAGQSKEELLKEIKFMSKGINTAFEKGTEWKTPAGSYFTASPLGIKGKVAFVYPGVGSSYIGMGQDIFYLFPQLYDWFSQLVPDTGDLLKAEALYPRNREHLSEDQIKSLERQLRRDIMSISESGMGFSVLFTMIMRNIFRINPDCALGYSLGEAAMMASLGVWQNPGQLAMKFRKSPVFSECLHGELSAVRDSWQLGQYRPEAKEQIWESYTLLTSPKIVKETIAGEEKVFLTLINTPSEVVIAGDPESCLRVINNLGCKYFPLRLGLAIHSGPTHHEYDRLVDLYMLPTGEKSEIKFYSSSCYKALPIRSKSVAHSIAKAFCETVDFPRLVTQVHEDGTKIFIEMGPRQACSLWINEILKDKKHIAIPINMKGVRDKVSIGRVLTQLISHRVPVDLSPLYKGIV